jgi:hypothetical protein
VSSTLSRDADTSHVSIRLSSKANTSTDRYAMPLYLQAVSLLLPPGAQNIPIEDRCRGEL